MEILEKKYISLIASRLRNFKWKSPTLANFSCPICGDSSKDKTKSRGYLFPLKNHFCYKCHNCSASVRFSTFLKKLDPSLYSQFVMERFVEGGGAVPPPKGETSPVNTDKRRRIDYGAAFKSLRSISSLNVDHPAKAYLLSRKIPLKYQRFLFFSDDFGKWAASEFPQHDNLPSEPRIVIPFFERNGVDVIGFQGRAITKTSIRYISLKYNENTPFVFGLERLDLSKTIHVTEGPLDSLFVPNCVAMATAGKKLALPPDKTVLIYDNEPRNVQVVGYMRRALDDGFAVVVWPKSVTQKDINDMVVVEGLTETAIHDMIIANTYRGLSGHLKITEWAKV